jgi:hypothetical protein
MKKMGFFGVAEATTFIGEVTLAFATGFETVSGKSSEPVPHAAFAGSCAVGAGKSLLPGVQLIDTGGVEGYEGCAGVVGVVGLVGVVGVVDDMFETELHPVNRKAIEIKTDTPNNRFFAEMLTAARIYQPPEIEY